METRRGHFEMPMTDTAACLLPVTVFRITEPLLEVIIYIPCYFAVGRIPSF